MNSECSCDSGYSYSDTNDSFNINDRIGLLMNLLFVSIIILSLFIVFTWNRLSSNMMIYILIILCVLFIGNIIMNPIHVLYMPSMVLSTFIRTPPILKRNSYFPNHKLLEDPSTFTKIQQEVTNMLDKTNKGNSLTLTKDSYGGNNVSIGSDIKINDDGVKAWRLLNIMVGESYTQDALDHFPTLVDALRKLPEVKSCVVSVLEPGIHIPIHVGYYKGLMRYMLPTHIPKEKDKVFLCVNGIKYHWTEGEGVLWDDTYAHKVYNNSNEIRVLIYMDVKRPLQNESVSFMNEWNDWFLNKVTGSYIIKKEIERTEKQIKI